MASEAINNAAHTNTIQEIIPPLPSIEGNLRRHVAHHSDYPLPSFKLKPRHNRNLHPDYFGEVGAGYIPRTRLGNLETIDEHPTPVQAQIASVLDDSAVTHSNQGLNRVELTPALQTFPIRRPASDSIPSIDLLRRMRDAENGFTRQHLDSQDSPFPIRRPASDGIPSIDLLRRMRDAENGFTRQHMNSHDSNAIESL